MGGKGTEQVADDVKRSAFQQAKIDARQKGRKLDTSLDEQFAVGRLYACISSRPGQCGRCDGYILEGKELEFYPRRCRRRRPRASKPGACVHRSNRGGVWAAVSRAASGMREQSFRSEQAPRSHVPTRENKRESFVYHR